MTRDELITRVADKLGNGGPCPGEVFSGGPTDTSCGGFCLTSEKYRTCWAAAIVDLVLGEMKEGEHCDPR